MQVLIYLETRETKRDGDRSRDYGVGHAARPEVCPAMAGTQGRVLPVILGGGRGTRLWPLTKLRANPTRGLQKQGLWIKRRRDEVKCLRQSPRRKGR